MLRGGAAVAEEGAAAPALPRPALSAKVPRATLPVIESGGSGKVVLGGREC